jgi:hypothetical protein
VKWLLITTVLAVAFPTALHSQDAVRETFEKGVYTNSTVGFRYVAPAGMTNTTASARSQVEQRAAALHRAKTFAVLLAMTSGPDDTASDWHSVGIQSYPREAFPGADDFHAESLMNASVARGGLSVGTNQSVVFSNQKFVATQFEMHEGTLTKHATVFTTVRGGQLLSFAFASNSAEEVAKMVTTMKSLSFTGSD